MFMKGKMLTKKWGIWWKMDNFKDEMDNNKKEMKIMMVMKRIVKSTIMMMMMMMMKGKMTMIKDYCNDEMVNNR